MSDSLFIDPGFSVRGEGCACALFGEAALLKVWFARPDLVQGYAPGVRHQLGLVQYESPAADGRKADAETLLTLERTGAILAAQYAAASQKNCAIERVKPADWKGSLPKPQHHRRVLRALASSELDLIEVLNHTRTSVPETVEWAISKGALDRWRLPGVRYYPAAFIVHNILDAVGMGLKHLRRIA